MRSSFYNSFDWPKIYQLTHGHVRQSRMSPSYTRYYKSPFRRTLVGLGRTELTIFFPKRFVFSLRLSFSPPPHSLPLTLFSFKSPRSFKAVISHGPPGEFR